MSATVSIANTLAMGMLSDRTRSNFWTPHSHMKTNNTQADPEKPCTVSCLLEDTTRL